MGIVAWLKRSCPSQGIVCAEIARVSRHPNADRLKICQLNVGSKSVQVHCLSALLQCGQHMKCIAFDIPIPISCQLIPEASPAYRSNCLQVVTNAPNVKEGMRTALAVGHHLLNTYLFCQAADCMLHTANSM